MTIIEIGNFFLTEDIGELTKACCEAVPEFGDVIKDVQNPYFRSTYADLANYIEATRGPLAKQGVYLFQGLGMHDSIPSVTTMLVHTSNQKLGFTFPMEPAKTDAQGIGGAISYDRRYSYGPATNTAGQEDDDGEQAVQRGEQLKKQEEQMAGQERISLAHAKAFMKAAADHGRTQEQIVAFLDELNGYRQVEEITKQDWEAAKTWALNQPHEDDLLKNMNASLQQARLKKLWAIANKKKVSDADVHRMVKETYQKESLKDLTEKQFNDVVAWLDSLNPAG